MPPLPWLRKESPGSSEAPQKKESPRLDENKLEDEPDNELVLLKRAKEDDESSVHTAPSIADGLSKDAEKSEGQEPSSLDNGEETSSDPTSGCLSRALTCLDDFDPLVRVWRLIMPDADRHCWLLFATSVFFIGALTYVMVDTTNRAGCNVGIPPFAMGLVFLSAGTSIPDALASIVAAREGDVGMSVANALGSNIFDILVGLALPWILRIATGGRVHFQLASGELLKGVLVLVASLLSFIVPLMACHWKLDWKIGVFLLLTYVAYVIWALANGAVSGNVVETAIGDC
jgi:Ca2+/Na+ antiporter